jgi:hypothetical protein
VRGRKKVHFLAPFLGSPRPNSSTTCSFTPLFLALWVNITLSDHLQQQCLGSDLTGSSFASKTGKKGLKLQVQAYENIESKSILDVRKNLPSL